MCIAKETAKEIQSYLYRQETEIRLVAGKISHRNSYDEDVKRLDNLLAVIWRCNDDLRRSVIS